MEEILESSPAKSVPQDKKNYATQGALENFISANNSKTNFITIANEKQRRSSQLANFFNQLYGRQCQIFCVFDLLDGVVARFLSAITQNL